MIMLQTLIYTVLRNKTKDTRFALISESDFFGLREEAWTDRCHMHHALELDYRGQPVSVSDVKIICSNGLPSGEIFLI